MAQTVQPQVFINYISQRKKIIVNDHNQPSQLLIQEDYYLNDTLHFQVINVNNQIVQLDSNTTYQLYGTYIDAKKQMHILFYTLGVTPRDNTLSFLVNTYTSQYLAYVKLNGTPINISIVAKQTTTGGGTRSYMVLRDSALANPRGYIEGQAPTDIVYQNVFNAEVPLTGSFGAGNDINLAQDVEGQDIATFAFGDTLSATSENQFVIGYNNTPDSTKAFIIANSGNIFTVDYEGNVSAGDLDVGAISATSVTINGEPVEYLMDDKLEATSAWVSGNYETTTNATNNYNTLNAKINNLSAADDGKFEATSGWVNSTFETKNDATDKYNTLTGQTDYLSGQVSSNTTAIGEITNALGSKANQTDLEALSGQVEGITVPTKVGQLENDVPYLSSIPTSYVQKNEIANMATTGWVDDNYAKKGEAPTDVYTKEEVNAISTALSTTVSEASYLTSVPDTVSATAVNTATGWVNEQGYQNAAQVSAIASGYAGGGGTGDVTSAQVSAIIEGYNYQTAPQVSAIVESYDYATTSQIPTDYTTSANVSAIVEGMSGDIRTGLATTDAISDMATKTWVGGQNYTSTDQATYIANNLISTSVSGLLAAGTNVTLTRDAAGVTTINATNGGGGGGGGGDASNINPKRTLTGDVIQYSQEYDIFETTENPVVDGVITIQGVEGLADLPVNKVATFEYWFKPSAAITGIEFAEGIDFIGSLPTSYTTGATQVFAVRLDKVLGNTKQYFSYAYQFEAPSSDPSLLNPLTFTAKNGSANIALNKVGEPESVELYYKKNSGDWTAYTVGSVIDLAENDTVSMSGATETFSEYVSQGGGYLYYQFALTGQVEASGNVQSLTNFSDEIADGGFAQLFSGCAGLLTAPDLPAKKVGTGGCYQMFKNCSSLIVAPQIQATNIAPSCYQQMFKRCYNLATLPSSLPAIKLYNYCYDGMFQYCSSLLTALALPANIVQRYSYQGMFKDCTSLTAAPALPATGIADSCYNYLFYNCSSLITPPQLPATGLATACYANMFFGCTSLTAASDLPATTLAQGCYESMFAYCTSLTDSPYLPATTLDSSNYAANYREMFRGCSSLTAISVAFTGWGSTSSYGATANWVSGVAANGVFTCPSDLDTSSPGVSKNPVGWTVFHPTPQNTPLTFEAMDNSVTLQFYNESDPGASLQYKKNNGSWTPATLNEYWQLSPGDTIAFSGNNGLFSNSSYPYQFKKYSGNGKLKVYGNIMSLLTGNFANATSLTDATYDEYVFNCLFYGNTAIVDASELVLPSTVLNYCYQYMFGDCSNLSAGPTLPALTMAEHCYEHMFYDCSHLTGIELPATTLAEGCYDAMLWYCGTITELQLPATTLAIDCYHDMCYGCSNLASVTVGFTNWNYYDDSEHTTSPWNSTNNWIGGVAANGTFTCPSNLDTTIERGDNSIPNDWTVVTV